MSEVDLKEFALGLLAFARDDNRDATDLLAVSFVELAARVEILCRQLEADVADETGSPKQIALLLQTESIRTLVSDNIIQMQAHDMTDQRLTHCYRLLSEEICDLQVLTDDKERKLAELLSQGATKETAIATAKSVNTSSVELF